MFASATEEQGVDEIKKMLKGKSTVFAGPSGVGKSSMLNALTKDYKMETGAISEKIGRGKHTTRHSEIFNIDSNSYVFDTPEMCIRDRLKIIMDFDYCRNIILW